MSSISTLIIRKPKAIQDSKILYEKSRYPMGFISICLWTLAAIIAAANAETNKQVTGVSVTFKMQDVLMMLLTTCMLARGISTGNPYLVHPWILISSWNIYQYQYPSLMKMLNVLRHTKSVSKLACVAFGIDILGIVTKVVLIIRVVQLSINLWYQRKLQNETLGKN